MGVEIYIQSQLCDPPKDSEVVGNFATNLLGEIKSRQGIYTGTIVLPDTTRNRLIFQNAQLLLSVTTIPYGRLDAVIRVNGVVHVVGFANLISSQDNFTINIIGGNGDWFDKIGEGNLNDMNLESLNHYWARVPVLARRAGIWSGGGIYPNLDYGEFTTRLPLTASFSELYFGVYCKYLLKELFYNAGFVLTGDWYDNNLLLAKMLLPFSAEWVRDRNYSQRNSGSWNTPITYTYSPDRREVFLTNTITSTAYNILNPYVPYPFDVANYITILDKVSLKFRIRLTVTNNEPAAYKFVFNLRQLDAGGTVIAFEHIISPDINAGATINIDQTFTRSIEQCKLSFEWFNIGTGVAPIIPILRNFTISAFQFDILEYTVDETIDDYLQINSTFNWITPGSTLPAVSKLDYLRTLWNQFGIIFSTDPATGIVNIFTLSEVQGNLLDADDWSDKIDFSEEPKITYELDGYSQKNIFKYLPDTNDETLIPFDESNNGFILVGNTNLEKESIVFESVFAPVRRVWTFYNGPTGQRTMGFIQKFIAGDINQVVPRICYVEINADNNITVSGTSTATQPNVYFDELKFTNLIPIYYLVLQNVLDNTKIINLLLKLNEADIANLNFSKPKYFAYYAAFFWLNEIKQYKFTSYESTPVELIRI